MGFKGKNHRDLSAIAPIDWARLAAFIDGEGCISIKAVRGYHASSRRVFYVDVTIANTDFRLMRWLQELFGGSVAVGARRNEKWSPCGKWNVASKYASAVLDGCMPYFIVKKEQAQVALDFQATVLPDRRFGRSGRPAAYVEHQNSLKEKLTDLKGTSGRRMSRVEGSVTIQ